ncbi:hypothetical protein HNR19_000522 [Nocardioides thalensis]|uniref:Flagellar hook-length control protein-like C-terminal domain-containing protein n=1 Tax=Nocardioides thalensis TaxID=1914755 RepID=A0A853BXN8_9ACTN|nr:flagellar hook-length control protein FliK [Nocardioides thalensis]NYI99823.1 hypothetical protein [Nocardioides thalensis]
MSVLPFAPGMMPGMTPGPTGPTGAAGTPAGGTAASSEGVVAEPGATTVDPPAFPDPGAEFAAALTAALAGSTPSTTPAPAAAAPAPDEPAGFGVRTGTLRGASWQPSVLEPAARATATGAAPATKDAGGVPLSGPVGTTTPATAAAAAPAPLPGDEPVAGVPSGATYPASTPPRGAAVPGDAARADDPATALASTGRTEASAPESGRDPEPRQVEPPTLPVRTPNPASSAITISPSGGAAKAAQDPVVQHVLPAVMQLATKGNGTHRISVTLQPEHLGEVRVTMVVRDGEVRVSLAADSQSVAKDVLLQGAPELRRLLEATGATDTRVVVRDLPSTSSSPPTSASPSGSTNTSTDRGFGEQAPGDPDRRQPGDQRHDGRGAVPTPSVQRAAATTSTAHPATPTPGRLDRTV